METLAWLLVVFFVLYAFFYMRHSFTRSRLRH
jgi:hypothetical protein